MPEGGGSGRGGGLTHTPLTGGGSGQLSCAGWDNRTGSGSGASLASGAGGLSLHGDGKGCAYNAGVEDEGGVRGWGVGSGRGGGSHDCLGYAYGEDDE